MRPQGLDDLPDIEAGADHGWATTGGAIPEVDERMLIGADPFIDVALGQGRLRLPGLLGPASKPLEGPRSHPKRDRLLDRA